MRPGHLQILLLACCAAAGAASGYYLLPQQPAAPGPNRIAGGHEIRQNPSPVRAPKLPEDPKVRGWLARIMETPAERMPAALGELLGNFPSSPDHEPGAAERHFFTAWLQKDEAGLLKWMETVSGDNTEFLGHAARALGHADGARLWPAVQQLCARREKGEDDGYWAEEILTSMAQIWAEADPGSFLREADDHEVMKEWIPQAVRAFALTASLSEMTNLAERGDPFRAMICMPRLMPELYRSGPDKAKDWLLTLEDKEVRAAGIAAWLYEHALTAPADALSLLAGKNWMTAELNPNQKLETLYLTARSGLAASVALLLEDRAASAQRARATQPPRSWVAGTPPPSRVAGGGRVRIASPFGGSGSGRRSGSGGTPVPVPPDGGSQSTGEKPLYGPLRLPSAAGITMDAKLRDLAGEYGVRLNGPLKDRVAAALAEIRTLPPAAAALAQPLLSTALSANAGRWSEGEMQRGIEAVLGLPEEFRHLALHEVLSALLESDAPALQRTLRSLPADSLTAAGPRVQMAATEDLASSLDLLFRPDGPTDAVPARYFDACTLSPAAEAAARTAGAEAMSAYAKNFARNNPAQAPEWAAALPPELAREACSGVAKLLGLTDTAVGLRWAQSLPPGPHQDGALEGLAQAIRIHDRAAADKLTSPASGTTNPASGPSQ